MWIDPPLKLETLHILSSLVSPPNRASGAARVGCINQMQISSWLSSQRKTIGKRLVSYLERATELSCTLNELQPLRTIVTDHQYGHTNRDLTDNGIRWKECIVLNRSLPSVLHQSSSFDANLTSDIDASCLDAVSPITNDPPCFMVLFGFTSVRLIEGQLIRVWTSDEMIVTKAIGESVFEADR